jgi:RNA polymerase sigma-70 factor (ECF subfamily)
MAVPTIAMQKTTLILQPAPATAQAVDQVEITDEVLMARIQKRDEEALTMLYYRHGKLLRSVISRCVYDQQHSEDLLQEVFVEIWNRADHYSEEKGRALGWLITLARRRALDRVRRFQAYFRAEQRLRAQEENSPLNDQIADGDAELEHRDLGSRLEHALAQLPPAQAQAVRLAYQEGLSQREIVARTGIPLGTIKTRIELGLRKLKSAMRGEMAAA